MRTILLFVGASLIVLVFGATTVTASLQQAKQDAGRTKKIAAIRAVLDAQVSAWNRGDLEGFMKGYWRSEATVFISGNSVTYGWQTVFDRYKKGYDTREKMGTLEFSSLNFNVIGKSTAVVHGSWALTGPPDKPHGRFTLIFRRTAQGWRIVHDHTSSA